MLTWTQILNKELTGTSKEFYEVHFNEKTEDVFISQHTIEGLEPGKTYIVNVRSLNCCGKSAFAEVEIKMPIVEP